MSRPRRTGSRGKFTRLGYTPIAVRMFSTSKNDGTSYTDSSPLVVFSDSDKEKLDILKYVKGKASAQAKSANSAESPGVSNDSANLFLNKLDPHFVTGFTDGEGSFIVSVTKAPDHKLGLRVKAIFRLNLHKEDLVLLKLIQSFFGGAGNIGEDYKGICNYTVYSLEEICNVIIPHFDKYLLITQKLSDYRIFRKVVMMIRNKEHLTEEGVNSIINLKSSLNRGLTEELKAIFPKSILVKRAVVENHPLFF
jgi:hypothetical protein